MSDSKREARQVATLAGGCFWCLEAVYDMIRGVEKVVSGYTGGDVANPTYKQVTTGMTGHAEAVQITYDPAAISYRELLEIFFELHDPTTLNRQGADVGPQYRSAIFYHDEEQRQMAEAMIGELTEQGVYANPIVTEMTPLGTFHAAEAYHQDYYRDNRNQPYCRVVISPKMAKVQKRFAPKIKLVI